MKDDLYVSHIVPLIRAVEHTTGPILELGMGFSTIVLHSMCKHTKRPLFSYENDPVWCDKYRGFSTTWHKIQFVDNWEGIMIGAKHSDIGVALIDHRPANMRRETAYALKDNAHFIILHDSEPENRRFYGYDKIYPDFKYVYQYAETTPHTAILSNFENPRNLWPTKQIYQ